MNQPPKLYSLQLLRFVAALLVLLFHLEIMPSGYKGVDVFFVISGFVIYYSTLIAKHKGAVQFFVNRFTKIYVLYWLVLAVAYIVYGYSLDKSSPATIFLLPGHVAVLIVSWSLSYELYFYIIFGLVVFALPARWHVYIFWLLFILTSIVTLLGFTTFSLKGSAINFLLGPNFWEFLLGVLICHIVQQSSISSYISAIGALVSVAALILTGIQYTNPLSYIVYGVLSFLLVGFIVLIEKKSSVFSSYAKLLAILGDASYAMYLTGFIYINIISPGTILYKIATIAVIILTSIVINRFIEMPLLKAVRRILCKRA